MGVGVEGGVGVGQEQRRKVSGVLEEVCNPTTKTFLYLFAFNTKYKHAPTFVVSPNPLANVETFPGEV